jgi:hypothetical protein
VRRIVPDMEDIKMLVLFKFEKEEAMVARYGQGTDDAIILKFIGMFDES